MIQYKNLLEDILYKGNIKSDRTGTGTISLFGHQSRYDLNKGFPLLTTKNLHLKSIIYELLWFLKGDTNIKYLQENGVNIWNEWADKNGELGPVYGKQWRSWQADNKVIDQITNIIEQIKTNPHSRRHIVSAWNVGDLDKMALPPCHLLFQFYVDNNKNLSLQLYQRSADVFLGVPFNIASYSLLLMMVAQVTDLKPKEFIHTIGDAHIYLNHIEQVELQLSRNVRELPVMKLNPNIKNIFDFKYEDFKLSNYNPHPHIKGKVAV